MAGAIDNRLKLTEEQKPKIREIEQKFANTEQRKQVMEARRKLDQLLRDKKVKRDQVLAQLDAVMAAEKAIEINRVDRVLAIRDILTDEQALRLPGVPTGPQAGPPRPGPGGPAGGPPGRRPPPGRGPGGGGPGAPDRRG